MSGFFGIVREDGKEVSPDLLQLVAEVQRFRGQNSENIWQRFGFGTCLAYLAISRAKQARHLRSQLDHR